MSEETKEWQYESICRSYGCKAKVFAKESGAMKKKIGNPDLLIIFVSTVSHKMMISVAQEAKKNRIPMERVHTSSATALHNILSEKCRAAVL